MRANKKNRNQTVLHFAEQRIEHAGLALHSAEEEQPPATHKSQVDGDDERRRHDPDQEAEGDVDPVEEYEGGTARAVRLLPEVGHVQLFSILQQNRSDAVLRIWIRTGSVFRSFWIRIRIRTTDPDANI